MSAAKELVGAEVNEDSTMICRKYVVEGFIPNSCNCWAELLTDEDIINPARSADVRVGLGDLWEPLLPDINEFTLEADFLEE
jgi:hypothetical protein